MSQNKHLLFFLLLFLGCPCLQAQERPNIVWSLADLSPRIGAYGDRVARTPHIDQLAEEGVRYINLHSVSGVCAPSRSALVSGMYPTSIAYTTQQGTAPGWPHWKLYTGPLEVSMPDSGIIRAVAVRYGFQHILEAALPLTQN